MVEIGSANLVLTGDVDFTATQTGSAPAVSVSGTLKTDNYSGDIAISGASNAITGGDVNLKTSGTISLSTSGTSPLVSTKTLSLEGDITLIAPNVSSSLLNVTEDISIKDTEGDLAITSASTSVAPIINSSNGTVTLSAPKGDITINSTATGYSYPSQAICANNIVVENAESLQITGNYLGQAISANKDITFKNCKSVSIQTDNLTALAASGKVLFENCDNIIVATAADKFAISGNTEFKGCKSVSVSTAGTRAIAGEYTCDGRLVITENGVTKIIENGSETVTGGDVTNTGLELGSEDYPLPTKTTVYVAGSGTITFIPATDTANAKLVLNNAEIDQKNGGRDSAIFFENNVDIEINGTNKFLALQGIISNGTINISGNGTLTVESEGYAVMADKDVVVNSGTLVLSGYNGIYAGKNVSIKDGNITVIPSYYGLYAYEGNITINNGTVNISSKDENTEGIVAFDRNDDKGIANIYIHGGTVNIAVDGEAIFGYDDIVIDGDANVTVKSYNDNGIYASGNVKIDDNARVKADGAGNTVDIYTAESCTVAESAKLTALVQVKNNYIAYGICDNNNIVKDIDTETAGTLEVKPGAEFTINAGTAVSVNEISDLTLDGKLINNGMLQIGITDTTKVPKGKIVNNGALLLAFADDEVDVGAVIREMELTGSNLVYVQTGSGENAVQDVYTIDGTKLNQITSIDLSNENLSGNLDTDGYHWNNVNKILTLKDVLVSGIIDGLTDDVTIQTKGNVAISEMRNSSGGKITVTGNSATIMFLHNRGDIIFKDITANIYGIWAYEEEAPQTLNAEDNYSYGVELINSKVTVGGMEDSKIYTKKLTMDDTSILTLSGAPIECYTTDETCLDGIKDYLPKNGGYKIGQDEDEEFYTILDSNNNIVRDITLKKAEAPKPSGSSGGGSSAKSYGITIKSAENGKVEASKKSASKNATITLTVAADEGYQLDKLTVLDSKNGAIALTDKTDGKFEFKMPDGSVTVEATFVKKAAEEEKPTEEKPVSKTFADVSANAWFKKAVDYVNGKGLMSGVDENNFGPELLTNRAMLVTILWRMEGCPTSEQATNFTDIKATDYFYNAVLWAAENKIVSGVSETSFAPNESITREQLAAILYRYAAYKGYDVTQGGMAVREFSDYESISGYARGSVAWAVNAGIVSGKGNNTLDPGGVATRAEVASMLMRFCENIVK